MMTGAQARQASFAHAHAARRLSLSRVRRCCWLLLATREFRQLLVRARAPLDDDADIRFSCRPVSRIPASCQQPRMPLPPALLLLKGPLRLPRAIPHDVTQRKGEHFAHGAYHLTASPPLPILFRKTCYRASSAMIDYETASFSARAYSSMAARSARHRAPRFRRAAPVEISHDIISMHVDARRRHFSPCHFFLFSPVNFQCTPSTAAHSAPRAYSSPSNRAGIDATPMATSSVACSRRFPYSSLL